MARRRKSNRRRRRGSFGFLSKVLCVLLICGAIVVALTLFFRVDTILVTGVQRYTEEEICTASGVGEGENLFLLNKYDVAQNIEEALPYVEQMRISRKLPDTLVIEIQECTAPLALTQDGITWLISPSSQPGGKIVDQGDASLAEEYPVIDGCELLAPSVGSYLTLATEYSLQEESLLDLLRALVDAGMIQEVDAIHLGDPSMLTMEFMGRFTVQLSYGADYDYKLRTLNGILETGKIQENMTGTFDMRRDDGKTNFIQSVPSGAS